ncbi:MAG: glycoside hydrolase family 3 C-terminal domain-containing protein, partial [Bacteroidetes bacterium]|nr:glycoside hydrolase family 3 C-terminal domain-containing protein [Bacteroidota bacterium]
KAEIFLAARMIENVVVGVQSTGTIATLKHFVCNNTDFRRRRSNSVVDERALHEIYLPAFKAGVDAGAMAVMTSYNQLNGEWAGQSRYVIDTLLKKDLGFKWLVMTDWWSTYDPLKVIRSGQDLEMPGTTREGDPNLEKIGDVYVRSNATRLLEEGKIEEADIDRMVRSILTTEVAMGLMDRPVRDESYLKKFGEHEKLALQEAREGIVLLRNENHVLPIRKTDAGKILMTGDYVTKLPRGGGSSLVEGYDNVTMLDAFRNEFGSALTRVETPVDDEIRKADVVIVSIGSDDSEGWDRPFELPEQTDKKILHYAGLNPNVVVIVNSGGGVRMTEWNDKVAGIIYAWYPGQAGNTALAEIVSGKVNPSGKLPITIEKHFADSPGHSYIPKSEKLYTGPQSDLDPSIPVYDVIYKEGVLVGYRWYETKKIEPLYGFGFGLSYTTFDFGNLALSKSSMRKVDTLTVKFTVKNTGNISGAEVAQLYVRELNPRVQRPVKELKGFAKVFLKPGESKEVALNLSAKDLSYWDVESHAWKADPGKFEILIGSASNDTRLSGTIVLED